MFAALWNFARKLHKQNAGFTIIEFLIVFVISSIIIAFAIPSLNSFNRWQALKTAGVELKTNLRQAQNKALAGEKACSSDTQSLEYLLGWYAAFNSPNTSYNIAHRCVFTTGDIPDPSEYSLKSYTAKGVTEITIDPTTVSYILFKPVTNGISFYSSTNPISFSGINLLSSVTRATITLTNLDEKQYAITIDQSGEITDAKVQ